MKTFSLLCSVFILLLVGCTGEQEGMQLKDIKLMEAGNLAIIKNKIKEAHMVCIELNHCGNNNDTVISTYYDTLGRLVKTRVVNAKIIEEFVYTDESNWETKRVFTAEGRVQTVLLSYQINEEDKVLTEYVIDGADTIGKVEYKFDDKGQVYEYGPDMGGLLHYLQYNNDGYLTKEVMQYPDTSYYIKKFGKTEMYTAYKTEDEFFYYESRLDSSIKRYFDIYGHKFLEPITFRARYDGLIETVQGENKYIFSYIKY